MGRIKVNQTYFIGRQLGIRYYIEIFIPYSRLDPSHDTGTLDLYEFKLDHPGCFFLYSLSFNNLMVFVSLQDTVIYDRLADSSRYKEITLKHLEQFATEGKWTNIALCLSICKTSFGILAHLSFLCGYCNHLVIRMSSPFVI